MERRIPNLFIVGAPRCGTTGLYFYLRRHPRIFMASVKEPHHFSPHLFLPPPQVTVDDPAAYAALFAGAGAARWVGEASPSYLYAHAATTAIAAASPEARIVITLRHPVDLMHSMYWLRYHNGLHHGYPVPRTFAEALAADEPGTPLSYREVGSVTAHVERYLEQFGRERVHIRLLEDVTTAGAAAQAALCAFLGIEDLPMDRGDPTAPSQWVRSGRLARWLARPPAAVRAAARALLPERARTRLRRGLRAFNRGGARPVAPDVRRALTREFTPEIRRLGRVIGRDLSHWLA